MIKKMLMAATAAGLVVAGAASAAQLDTTQAAGTTTVAGGDVTINGATLKSISFGKAYAQDFTVDTAGFIPNQGSNVYGLITAENGHAVAKDNGTGTGPFTELGGYTTKWTGPMTASVDVYLDPTTWDANSGFDYSVAATKDNGSVRGAYGQDFIFNVSNNTSDGSLRVGASTNSSFAPANLGASGYKVVSAGYYTLQHSFTEGSDGNLDVTMSIVKDGAVAMTFPTFDAVSGGAPIKAKDSGHRYGWFTFTTEDLKIDNVSLVESMPGAQGVDSITVKVDKQDVNVTAKVGNVVSAPTAVNEAGVAVIKFAQPIASKDLSQVHLVVSS